MIYSDLCQGAESRHLSVLGAFHPGESDETPEGCETLVMLGPNEPEFWAAFTSDPEWHDGRPDPIDRWSERVIGSWATDLGAEALFPFGGPPYTPFYRWALRTGRIHSSPVQLLVHDTAGLFVSFRGALAFPVRIELPLPPQGPCGTCVSQPCKTACSVEALTPEGYDVPKCRAFLRSAEGAENMATGCNVRRSCPVSQTFGRLAAQSAFHMAQFARGQ